MQNFFIRNDQDGLIHRLSGLRMNNIEGVWGEGQKLAEDEPALKQPLVLLTVTFLIQHVVIRDYIYIFACPIVRTGCYAQTTFSSGCLSS